MYIKYGIITALVYSAIELVFYFTFGNTIGFTTKFFIDFVLLNLALYIFLYFPIKDKIYSLDNEKYYYGEGMKSGFGASFVAAIIITIFTWVYYKYVNKDFFHSIDASTIEHINNSKLDSLKKANSIKTLIANSSPVTIMLQQFAFTIISGMIASFLLGALISNKRKKSANK